jgi:hypothetical protein
MHVLDRLAPTSDAYATLPVDAAFTWDAVSADLPPGEWYMVAFRSVRRPDVDDARLAAYDDWAHEEASRAPGFFYYFKGPAASDRTCMSFCFWNSRAEARAASGQPKHRDAVKLTSETYERYTLEFHRVTKRSPDAPLEFAPYDPVPAAAALVEPGAVPGLGDRVPAGDVLGAPAPAPAG